MISRFSSQYTDLNGFFCRFRQSFLVLLTLLWASQALAEATLTLGIFAYRPKEVLLERYQPLADHLTEQLKTHRVVLRVLTQAEMEQAVEREELDFVFTNPSHYVLLRNQGKFTGVLATLVSLESGKAVDTLGGVIITNHARNDISSLEDLKHRNVGIPGSKFLGGYQTQAYELLRANIVMNEDVHTTILGSHDNVVEAVLSGKVDAGFIRTGVIEELIKTNKLQPNSLRIINEKHHKNFPFLVSTRLYPEWAFVATPKLEAGIIRKVVASLLVLDEAHPVSQRARIGGFAPPGDYQEVDALSRTLRLAPYDNLPSFSLHEIWKRWQVWWISLILLATSVLLFFVISLYRQNQQLIKAKRQLQLAANVFSSAQEGIMITDTEGIIKEVNPAFTHITGYTSDEVVGKNASILQSGIQDSAFYEAFWHDLKRYGHWSGIIWNKSKMGHVFAEKLTINSVKDTHNNIEYYAALFSDVTQQKADEEQLRYSAYHDTLTTLPNRALFNERLKLAIDQATPNHVIALALIDLDGFKAINDTLGHKAGDDLLIQFSERIRHLVRKKDTVARLGGDEFVVLLVDVSLDDELLIIIKNLLIAASEPFVLNHQTAQVSCSIGYSVYPQQKEISIESLLHQADEAMYVAKKMGKNQHCAYTVPTNNSR